MEILTYLALFAIAVLVLDKIAYIKASRELELLLKTDAERDAELRVIHDAFIAEHNRRMAELREVV